MHHHAAEMHLVDAECALLEADVQAARQHLASLGGELDDPRVEVRQRIAQAALCLAEGQLCAALAALPADDAPGHNAELRMRALAVQVAAESAQGTLTDATHHRAAAALAVDGVHAVAQLLLHQALRRAGVALAAGRVERVAAMVQTLRAHPAQRQAFARRWA